MNKILLIAIILAFLAVTNPTRADYSMWATQQVMAQANDGWVRAGISFLGPPLIETSTTVQNLTFFSIFETSIDFRQTVRVLGIAKQFIPLTPIPQL